MSRVVKVNNGDYIVQTQTGGHILLDVGGVDSGGDVRVNGNLIVTGNQTTINTNDTTIEDNIIILNSNEDPSHAGVSLGSAGIQIDRGSSKDAQIIWSESVPHYDPILGQTVNGTFVLKLKDSNLSGLQLGTIVVGNTNLVFDMRNTNSVLSLVNTVNYEQRVLNTNDIPNKKYITDYVAATGGTADVSHIQYPASAPIGTEQTSVVASSATIDFSVNEILKARVSASGLSADNVLIAGDSIKDVGSNNLELRATNNGVEVKAVLNLDTVESLTGDYDVNNVAGLTKIYASESEGPGRTGLYFVNNTAYGVNSYNNDELVSKNRAVLLSILL
jgi:hypothetical protein